MRSARKNQAAFQQHFGNAPIDSAVRKMNGGGFAASFILCVLRSLPRHINPDCVRGFPSLSKAPSLKVSAVVYHREKQVPRAFMNVAKGGVHRSLDTFRIKMTHVIYICLGSGSIHQYPCCCSMVTDQKFQVLCPKVWCI